MRPALRSALRALPAVAGALVLTLVGVEIVLRTLFVAPRLVSENYPLGAGIAGSELRLEQSEYDIRLRYNQFGFRDREFPLVKAPGEKRILVLGDSFAEGIGVARKDRFASILERDLVARGRDVVVIDAGQMGTAPAGYFRNLTNFGIALHPDLVIMAVYIGNDFSVADTAAGAEKHVNEILPEHARTDHSTWASFLTVGYVRLGIEQLLTGTRLLYRRPARTSPWEVGYGKPIGHQYFIDAESLLKVKPDEVDAALAEMDPALVEQFLAGRLNPSFLIAAIAQKVAARRGGAPPPPPPPPVSAIAAPVVQIMRRAYDLLARRGIGFLVLVVPDVHEMAPAEHAAFLARLGVTPVPAMERGGALREEFVRELNARGIPVLDLAPALRAVGARAFHVMDGHFNETGQRIAAQQLLARLGPDF